MFIVWNPTVLFAQLKSRIDSLHTLQYGRQSYIDNRFYTESRVLSGELVDKNIGSLNHKNIGSLNQSDHKKRSYLRLKVSRIQDITGHGVHLIPVGVCRNNGTVNRLAI